MSVSYSVAREYLERSSFPVVALDLILDLPDIEDQEEIFFERFCKFIGDRQLSQIINANAIQYYSLFNKLYEMIEKILLKIENTAQGDIASLQVHQNKLLKCLVCIYDLIFICEDTSSLKIQHIFPKILEHVSSVEHIINLYAIASILFFCKTASQTDFEMYPKILFHGTPFMKLFDIYGMDIARIYAKCDQKEESQSELTTNFLKVAKHGAEILDYFRNSMEEEINSDVNDLPGNNYKLQHVLPPKVVMKNIIEKYNIRVELGSYEYYSLLGEVLLGYYIFKNKADDIISVLTAIQSFCGIFLDFVYQKDEGAKYSIFPSCQLYQEFEPLPHPSIVDVIVSYFKQIRSVTDKNEKIVYMKKLHNLVRSLSLSLQMESYFANRKRYKPQFTRLLHKFLIPQANTQDFGLWELVCSGEDLCKGIVRHFSTIKEIKHYLLVEKYDPFEFYAEEILEYVLEIVESTMLEITVVDEESLMDVSIIIPEYYYAGRKLNDHFLKKCLEFTWLDNYISVYLWRDYFLCLRAFFSVKENVNDGLVIRIFAKFEELIRLSNDDRFLDFIRSSPEPEALVKKHRYLLNLLKGEFRIILAKEDIDTSPFNNLFNQIAISSLMDFLLAMKPIEVNDKFRAHILENCVHAFVFLHTLAQITYPENDKINFYVEETVKNVSKLTMDFVQDKYKFYELSCFFFQVLKDVGLLMKTFALIPKHFEKLLIDILPDVNIHYNQLAHFFDPLIPHIFVVLDASSYLESAETNQCVDYINKFLHISRKVINSVRQDFEAHHFESMTVDLTHFAQKDHKEIWENLDKAKKRLVHESFLCKTKSKMLFFGKIFRNILTAIEHIILDLQQDQLKELCETINDIFLNPILLYIEWSCMSKFLDIMKKICSKNDFFHKRTMERLCVNFLEITNQLDDLVQNNPRESDKIQRIKGLINSHRDFWEYYKEHELDVISTLGQPLLFSIVKLDTLALFFDFFFDSKARFANDSLQSLVRSYDKILQVCVLLEMYFKYDILVGTSEVDSSKAPDLSSLESMNLYMKVLILYIFPSLAQTSPAVSQDTMQRLANFVKNNLDFKNLSKQQIKNDPMKLIRQIHVFSLMLAHFPIEHQPKYVYLRVFLSMDVVLESILEWIAGLLRTFEKFSDCKWQIISRLENLLSKFMKQLHLIFQVLYTPAAAMVDPLKSVSKIKEKEKVYCEYLCKMIQIDFPYYENFSSKDTLYKIFNSLNHFIETMTKYRNYHTKVAEIKNPKRRTKRVKGRQRKKDAADDPILTLESTESQLKEEGFFEDMYELIKISFRKGLRTPCFLIFVLSNEHVQNDLTKLFGVGELDAIENMLRGLLMRGAKLLKREKMLVELGIVDSTKVEKDSQVFLNFTFYKKKAQKSLRVIEYINVVLAVAVKHCSRFKEKAGNYLDYSHEFGIEILNGFALSNFSNLNGENTLQTLINCYNSLLSRVCLLSLYKVRLNMFKLPRDIKKRDKEIISKSFEMILKQFALQDEFKKKVLPQGLFLKETYEPYLFLFSVWWFDDSYLQRLMSEPKIVTLLLDNANSELSLRFLVSIFTICGVNAFPASQICEVILKGLVFSDNTGKLLMNSGRVDVYQEIVTKQMKKVASENFDISKCSITLSDPMDSYYSVTISEPPKTKKKSTKALCHRVPTYDYLLCGLNDVTKQTLSNLLEAYLRWFDDEVVAIHEGRQWTKKIFHPIFVLSLLIYKFPELVPYMLSYPISLDKYTFPKYFKINRISDQLNFFEFMVRINFYYFPSFIFIHEFVCYNSRQPLAIQFSSQVVLMHELFARFFLEEILKVLKEDLADHQDTFCNTPESIRKWGIYPTIAFHIFAMCSYKERTYIPIAIFEKYTVFILECIALWRKKKPNGYFELVGPLLRLLQELAHFSLLQGIRVRLQKIEHELPQKEWNWIQNYKKCMKLVKFLGKKSRDALQKTEDEKGKKKEKCKKNAGKDKQNSAKKMEVEEKEKEEDLSEIVYEKDIPYKENNLRDLIDPEAQKSITAPASVSNYEPNLKKYKWEMFAKQGKLPNEFIHNTGSVNIFAGYLGLFSKIHDNINKFIDNFQHKTDDIKETRRILNSLHAIDKEYFSLHTSHPKIMNFDWKTRFGVEPPNMFNYNSFEEELKLKTVDFKKNVAAKLHLNARNSLVRRITKKPIKKQDLTDTVNWIRLRGNKIKSKLHNFLEKSILSSARHYDWAYQTLQDIYKPTETKDLEAFLKSKKPIERNAMFYFMDDSTFDRLPASLKEKGKVIKKMIERDMKQATHLEEDEMDMAMEIESDEEDENSDFEILEEEKVKAKEGIQMADDIEKLVAVDEENEKKTTEDRDKDDEIRFKKGDDEVEERKGKSSVRSARRKVDTKPDYDSEEEIELVDESRVEDKDNDYESGNEEEIEMEKKKDEEDLEEEDEEEEKKELGSDIEKEEEDFMGTDESEYEEDEDEDDAEEAKEDEEEHDFEGLSFCTNSDISEIFYDEYSEFKASEEGVMEKIYSTYLADHNILDKYNKVIVTLPDNCIKDILTFFASEHYYDFRYPTAELNSNVETYYRQLELLMINPENQTRLLSVLTFIINCPAKCTAITTLTEENHVNFVMNILQFLHFYARSNPQCFFMEQTKYIGLFEQIFQDIVDPSIPAAVLAIKDLSLISRIMRLFSIRQVEDNVQLARKIVNMLCYFARVSYEKKYKIPLGADELNQLGLIATSKHGLECGVFRKRAGKMFRYLGKVPENQDVFQNIERKIVQDESQELLYLLTEKYEQVNEFYKRTPNDGRFLPFEEVSTINKILQCSKLELYCETLKSIDDHLAADVNSMLIINFIEKMKDSGQMNKMISVVCQLLIIMKKIRDLNNIDFPMLVPSMEAYIFTLIYMYYLIRQAKMYGDKKLKTLKSLTQKNATELEEEMELEKFEDQLNNENLLEKLEEVAFYTKDLIGLVFKTNIAKISKDSRVLQIMSALNVIPSLATKEKVMRAYFSQSISEDTQYILPLTIRRGNILTDSLRAFEMHYQKLKKPSTTLKITFAKEAGVDEGGLKKEWLALLINELYDPKKGLFKLSHNQRCLYPSPQSFYVPKALSLFKITGIIIGLSIKENIPTGISFCRGFLKLILDQDPGLNDLEELDPDLAKSLLYIIENPIDGLDMPFTYETELLNQKEVIELVDNGRNKLIAEDNKHEYVHLLLQAKLHREVDIQTKEFKKGLFEIVPESLIKLFLPYELETLICGQSQVDVEDLMQNVQYRDCSRSDKLIQWFWEVVEGFELEERTSLLFFITGSSSIPYGGFKETKITIIKSNKDNNSLPVAHTCYSELELPNYTSREVLEKKLRFAISEGKEGFHIA